MLKLLRKPGYPPGAVGRGKLPWPQIPQSPAWSWGSIAMAVVPWGLCDIWGPDADRQQLTSSRDAGCAFWWCGEENREGRREMNALIKPLTGDLLQDVSCPQHVPSTSPASPTCASFERSHLHKGQRERQLVLQLPMGFCAVQVYSNGSRSAGCCLSTTTTHSHPCLSG